VDLIEQVEGSVEDGFGWLLGGYVEPVDAGEPAEPGALMLCEAACIDFYFFDGFAEGEFSVEVVDYFGVAYCAACLGTERFWFVE